MPRQNRVYRSSLLQEPDYLLTAAIFPKTIGPQVSNMACLFRHTLTLEFRSSLEQKCSVKLYLVKKLFNSSASHCKGDNS